MVGEPVVALFATRERYEPRTLEPDPVSGIVARAMPTSADRNERDEKTEAGEDEESSEKKDEKATSTGAGADAKPAEKADDDEPAPRPAAKRPPSRARGPGADRARARKAAPARKSHYLRTSPEAPESPPLDEADILIAYKGGQLPPTAEVRFASSQVWVPVGDFLEQWEKGLHKKDWRQVFGGLGLVVAGFGLAAVWGAATGVSILFLGLVAAGGSMFFRGMRGGAF